MQNDENKVKRSFFQNMKNELKKVIWPSGKETVKSTFVTITFVLIISAILIILNLAFDFLSSSWYKLILGDNSYNSIVNQLNSGDLSGDEESGDTYEDLSGDVSGEDNSDISGEITPDTDGEVE